MLKKIYRVKALCFCGIFLAVGGIFKNILVFVELRKNVVHCAQNAREILGKVQKLSVRSFLLLDLLSFLWYHMDDKVE